MPARLKKPKKRTVMVRFNEEQYAKLQEVADAAELPVAVYCRAMVVKAVGRGDVEPPIRGNVSTGSASVQTGDKSAKRKRAA